MTRYIENVDIVFEAPVQNRIPEFKEYDVPQQTHNEHLHLIFDVVMARVRRNTAPASPTAPAGNYRTGA